MEKTVEAQGPVDVIVGQLHAMAAKSDAALSKRAGYETSDVRTNLDSLLKHWRVEVGYRQSCGKTDYTQYAYREWAKLLKAAEKGGLRISVEPVKHGNSWATKSGGFWSSSIYTLKTPNEQGNGRHETRPIETIAAQRV